MLGIIFDTSVYISALRQGDASIIATRRVAQKPGEEAKPLWLSVVVLEELLAGARDKTTKKLLARLERDFESIQRLLVPTRSDWIACGQVLSLIGQRYGQEEIGRAGLTNDTLIALSASRNGLAILTCNADDFKKIATFRSFVWEER